MEKRRFREVLTRFWPIGDDAVSIVPDPLSCLSERNRKRRRRLKCPSGVDELEALYLEWKRSLRHFLHLKVQAQNVFSFLKVLSKQGTLF